MVNAIIDTPITTTNTAYAKHGKMSLQTVGACLCAAVFFTGALSSASVPFSQPIYSSKVESVSTNPTQALVYDNGGLSVYLTSAGDITVNQEVRRNFDVLGKIAQLESNWDNDGASGFSARLIERCYDLVQALAHQPEIFPTAQDSIQFEWENDAGDYLEVELFENEEYQMALRTSEGNWTEQAIDYAAIGGCVEKFFAKTV